MKLALAQYPLRRHESFSEWASYVEGWVKEAAEAKALVAVFPEYGAMETASFMSQSAQKSLPLQISEMQTMLPEFLRVYGQLAKKYRIALLAPSLPVKAEGFVKPVNRAFFFYPDGRFDFQDKRHMTRFEDEVWGLGPGSLEQKIFEVAGVKFGVSVCFDVEFPFAPLELAAQGAQVLLAPSCTESLRGLNRVHIGARARALENQYYVAVSQTVGNSSWSEAVDVNTGRAACYSTCDTGFPEDGVLMLGEINKEGWCFCDLEIEKLNRVRAAGQVFNYKNMQSYLKSEKT